jgi:hypothetical protein
MENDFMTKNTALLMAGIIFGIVFIMHILRLLCLSQVIIAGYVMPMWTSVIGAIIALFLCMLMLISMIRKGK